CLVLKRVGCRGGTHDMNTARYSQFSGVAAHNLVNAIRGKRAIELASAIVANRSEEGTGFVACVTRGREVVGQQRVADRMQGDIANLPSLSVDAQMRHTAAWVNSRYRQRRGFLAPEPVIKQHR